MVQLLSSDNETFTVDKQVAERSILIKNMLEDVGESDAPIPLPNVTAKILKKVIDWCEHHRGDPVSQQEEINDRKRLTEIDEWDQKFMEVDQETLFEIILAANYLDIKPLLDIGCKTVANMIKGKSPEEIRRTFNIVNDFTPEVRQFGIISHCYFLAMLST
ncbi:hypothetical protein INT43_004220 [Umbelopsis isabellina]|uniref:E3 ubiquitin ligase complex SCF subunit n=1 Tax=Mortierella isabellina TaxID=91625 RepID=A0A8H7PII3_MORIS|nr:hypothetical protein INT43_004220 [Umbelopsis isabellina]